MAFFSWSYVEGQKLMVEGVVNNFSPITIVRDRVACVNLLVEWGVGVWIATLDVCFEGVSEILRERNLKTQLSFYG